MYSYPWHSAAICNGVQFRYHRRQRGTIHSMFEAIHVVQVLHDRTRPLRQGGMQFLAQCTGTTIQRAGAVPRTHHTGGTSN